MALTQCMETRLPEKFITHSFIIIRSAIKHGIGTQGQQLGYPFALGIHATGSYTGGTIIKCRRMQREEAMATKDIQTWLNEYGESHQDKTNKAIHWVCVPLIFWTIMAFVWAIPTPAIFAETHAYLNWASIVSVFVILYYVRLSPSLAIGMSAFTVLCFYTVALVDAAFPGQLVPIAGAAFVVLWIFQFIGHKIEGKKPSFFKDIQFLMFGPAWLMSFVYQKMGFKY